MKRRSSPVSPGPAVASPDAPPAYDEELSLQELTAFVRCVKNLTALMAPSRREVDSDRETMRQTIAELRDVLRRMFYPEAAEATATYNAEGHLILPDAALLTPNRRYYAPFVAKLERAMDKMVQIRRLNRSSDGCPSSSAASDWLSETGKTPCCQDYTSANLFGIPRASVDEK